MNTGSHAQINVTPLIDVLLVLLIIFMVITPLTPRGLNAQLPQPAVDEPAPRPAPPLVLSVDGEGALRLNQETVPANALDARLRQALAVRAERTVFVQGDRSLEYAVVARLIDTATGAGASRVALLTDPLIPAR